MPELDSRELRVYYDKFYVEGDFRHYSVRLSMAMFQTLLEKLQLQNGNSILDIGCGTGYYTDLIAAQGMKTTGVDISLTGLKKARERNANISLVCGDANFLPFGKEQFSAVFLFGCSLMNTSDDSMIHRLLSESALMVQPGGWIVFTTSSDFSGKTKGGWLQRLPEDFRRMIGMFRGKHSFLWITHPRMFAFRGLALHQLTTILIRFVPLRFPRMILCAIQKPESESSENWGNS